MIWNLGYYILVKYKGKGRLFRYVNIKILVSLILVYFFWGSFLRLFFNIIERKLKKKGRCCIFEMCY